MFFLKKLTHHYQRPLVLKSPPHTCRIGLLLELFPEAKFVHIHRNPLDVFSSTMRLIDRGFRYTCFQNIDRQDWVERTLRVYEQMYDRFFEEQSLIASDRFCEVRFEDLEADPLQTMRSIYKSLSLPFEGAEPNVRAYLKSVADYQKNEFPPILADIRQRIVSRWRRSFDAWGYSINSQS